MQKELDEILFEIKNSGFIAFSKDTPDEQEKALQKLSRYCLVYEKNRNTFYLTAEGQMAVELGGYKKWLEKKESEDNKDKQIKDLTIKQLKGSVFQLKYWWVMLLLSAVVGFVSGNFSLILNWFK